MIIQTKLASALTAFVSEHESKYATDHVLLQQTKDKCVAVATNGTTLMVARWDSNDVSQCQFLVKGRFLQRVVEMAELHHKATTIDVSQNNKHSLASFTSDGTTVTVAEAKKEPITFPPWEKVAKLPTGKAESAALEPKRLHAILDACRSMFVDIASVKITFGKTSDRPVMLTYANTDLAVEFWVMPLM